MFFDLVIEKLLFYVFVFHIKLFDVHSEWGTFSYLRKRVKTLKKANIAPKYLCP